MTTTEILAGAGVLPRPSAVTSRERLIVHLYDEHGLEVGELEGRSKAWLSRRHPRHCTWRR